MQNTNFKEWKQKVNVYVVKLTGLSCDDLPDYPYYNAYQNGDSPSVAAKDVIRAAKDF